MSTRRIDPPKADSFQPGISARDAFALLNEGGPDSSGSAQALPREWPGIVFSQRPDFSYQFVSDRIETWTGFSVEELATTPDRFWQAVHPDDAAALRERWRNRAAGSDDITSHYRFRHAATGQITYVNEIRRTLRDAAGVVVGYEGLAWDITRQTIAEQRLATVSSRENLGLLSMGLTHDFCNLMTAIIGVAQTFEGAAEPDEPLAKGLKLISETAFKASQLAHRLRKLHQAHAGERNFEDLNAVASGVTDLLQKVLRARIQLKIELAKEGLPVFVDAVELQQVVVNLVLNAADAIAEKGEIVLKTCRYLEQPVSVRHLQGKLPPAPLVCLSVRDSGAGIESDLLDSIFEPFFTTKAEGKGTGLGLYNARLFAEKHHAAISVESEPGKGSTFSLWLPEAPL